MAKKMNLVFISPEQYPDGGAASNRHLAYSKGLVELGHNVTFILTRKQEWEGNTIILNGIRFYSVHRIIPDELSKLNKIRFHLRTISAMREKLDEINRKEPVSGLIFLSISLFILLPFLKYAKKNHLKTFHERTEYPFAWGGKTRRGKIERYLYLNFVVKKFDGLYVINQALKKYFSGLTKSDIAVVNMIVDPSRFENIPDKRDPSETIIAYCGTLDDNKDGVPILLESFARVAHEFPQATLKMIGSLNNENTKRKMESIVKELDIESRVNFTGYLRSEEVPKSLKNADILALARPNTKQSEGGFPTKLGEYLATGLPVVVTNTGEIGLFLKDKVNAYISEPDSALKFSEKLREALLNVSRGEIGLEGQKLAYNEFNYRTQARVIERLILNTTRS